MSLLTLQGISKAFGGLQALNDVSFSVREGLIKGVIGPNGAGKTTLFNCISGALAPDSGEILFREGSIQNLPTHMVAKRGIARTFQNIKLFSRMTVLENVMVGRHLRSRSGSISSMLGLPGTRREERSIREKSLQLLDELGIADLSKREATSLAFGRQRIVEFARALAMEPELLLLDEPAAGLNIQETREISRMITRIRERGITILIIEHDMSLIMDISDEIVVLGSGRKIAEGLPGDIQRNAEVIRIYLGDENAAG